MGKLASMASGHRSGPAGNRPCTLISGLVRGLLDLVYPSNIYCISCNVPIETDLPYSLCEECIRAIPWANESTCRKCGKALESWYGSTLCKDCHNLERNFDTGFTCAQYDTMTRSMLIQFKYQDQSYLGAHLGEVMADRMKALDQNLDPKEDLVLAVPMHQKKQRRRGYNQAALLAREVATRREKPFRSDLLLRRAETKAMFELTAKERRENMRQAFYVPEHKAEQLRGKVILLVDDIFTTGSTADACAQTLLAAGAKKVFLLTFASGFNSEAGAAQAVVASPSQMRAKGPT